MSCDEVRVALPILPDGDADEAARIVWRGIESKNAVVAFPWQLASVVRTASLLPASLYDRAVGPASGRTKLPKSP